MQSISRISPSDDVDVVLYSLSFSLRPGRAAAEALIDIFLSAIIRLWIFWDFFKKFIVSRASWNRKKELRDEADKFFPVSYRQRL